MFCLQDDPESSKVESNPKMEKNNKPFWQFQWGKRMISMSRGVGARDISKMPKMAPKMPKMAPRCQKKLQDDSRWA